MMSNTVRIIAYIIVAAVVMILLRLNSKANLKKEIRDRQFLMPLITLIYSVLFLVFTNTVNGWVEQLISLIPTGIQRLGTWFSSVLNGSLNGLGRWLVRAADSVRRFFAAAGIEAVVFVAENLLFLIAHILVKRIITGFLKGFFKPGRDRHDIPAGWFYEHEDDSDKWVLKEHFGLARTFLKVLYYGSAFIAAGASIAAFNLFRRGMLSSLFFPVFGAIVIGECYFALAGLTKEEHAASFEPPETQAGSGLDLRPIRDFLKKLFGDKLSADDTFMSLANSRTVSNEEMLTKLDDEDGMMENYALFMKQKMAHGFKADQNYLLAGRDLLQGKSILFNNPFYYDLIPYIFYPMNRTLLMHRKVLIVLGRHDMEEDLRNWCIQGLSVITGIPEMWDIAVLNDKEQNPDVGILTRSSVHDQKLHEANKEFFKETAFVVLIEPSKLVTTAQVGLNSVVRYCQMGGHPITYCSTDKNCDGLVDALSHILMTNLTEVDATTRPDGISTYMIWSPDKELLQHRMIPSITRYLGVGTELSFAGLKNQISHADWYGGDAFPVRDMRWIARQYYYDLLHYANRPALQEELDKYFHVMPNLWNARKEKDHYMTVEDEAFNMFEVRRDFATRAEGQGFVNVITSDYLLKDYMADNEKIFTTDPKAIPYIVADYARTVRNVVLRLCLRMTIEPVREADVLQELLLIGIKTESPAEVLWHAVCEQFHGGNIKKNAEGGELLILGKDGKETEFSSAVIQCRRKYSVDTGRMENLYSITDPAFIEGILGNLQNAGYVAEDDKGERQFLGTELRGHIFQKYLPGQFFTLGGKYYEMLRLTPDGRVMVRRAADHITGRPMYRQVREYELSRIRNSTMMGDEVNIADMQIIRQYADVHVKTSSYWDMKTYNDFLSGSLVKVNGIPDRIYRNKQVLKVVLPENTEPEIYFTMVTLLNEVFRTLFAENQDYICAVLPGHAELPQTYSLKLPTEGSCFYIIEDSELDIGLLETVRRNMRRIFFMICDYLEWHRKKVEDSMKVPEEPEGTGDEPITIGIVPGDEPEKKKGIFRKILDAIKRFFRKIGEFFKKLFNKIFRRKKKKDPEGPGQTGEPIPAAGPTGEGEPGSAAVPEGEGGSVPEAGPVSEEAHVPEEVPADEGEAIPEEIPADEGEAVPEETPADEGEAVPEEAPADEGEAVPEEVPADEGEAVPEEAPADEGEAVPKEAPADEAETTVPEEVSSGEDVPEDNAEPEAVPEVSYAETDKEEDPEVIAENTVTGERYLYSRSETVFEETEPSGTGNGGTGDDPQKSPDEPVSTTVVDGNVIEFEPETPQRPGPNRVPGTPITGNAYHERHYLRYGGIKMTPKLDVDKTYEFLIANGFGNGELKQARTGMDLADLIEQTYVPNQPGVHYCDFCGAQLIGNEYEVLKDGRERCLDCAATSIKTAEEFNELFREVTRNLEMMFGVRNKVSVRVQMVNAKKLHRRLKKRFVPTGSYDGRTLGVAIQRGHDYEILLENGAPRVQSAMTMAHEMTHIWQYLHWDSRAITKKYGKDENVIYEGMAMWVEVQYAYLIGEIAAAKREEISTRLREDEYGKGFRAFVKRYPLKMDGSLPGRHTPFEDVNNPL